MKGREGGQEMRHVVLVWQAGEVSALDERRGGGRSSGD